MAIFAKVGPIEGLKPLEPLLAGTEHSIAAGNAASSSLVPTVGWQGRAGPVVLSGLPEDFLSKKNKIQNLILKTDLSVTRVAFLTRIYVYKTPESSLIVGK
jgi:hypothetical protein